MEEWLSAAVTVLGMQASTVDAHCVPGTYVHTLTAMFVHSMHACMLADLLAAFPPVASSLLATLIAFSFTYSSSFSAVCLRPSAVLMPVAIS